MSDSVNRIDFTEDIATYGFDIKAQPTPLEVQGLSSGLISTFGYYVFNPVDTDHIANHIERTVELLIEQFRKNPRISKLVGEVVKQYQETEDVLFDLVRFRNIVYATGLQLDKIGAIVGLSRTSTDDETYRADIYFQIAVNTSNGTPEDVISALQRATNSIFIDYREIQPAVMILGINQARAPIPKNLFTQMKRVKPAGVRLQLTFNNSTNPFVFGSDINSFFPPAFTGRGFGETSVGHDNTSVGGNITEFLGGI